MKGRRGAGRHAQSVQGHARTLDGHTYCPGCSDYVGASAPAVSYRLSPLVCYRCGARTLALNPLDMNGAWL